MRGSIVKFESRDEIRLERNLLERRYILKLDKKLCIGCGICVTICPKDAIKLDPAVVDSGRLTKKPTLHLDADSCILCGECSVLCPLNALTMWINEEQVATIVKNEAFPKILKEISIDKSKCNPICGLKCQDACPREAIEVLTSISKDGKISGIKDVKVNDSLCVYCGRCEAACPLGAIRVKKPFEGFIELNTENCQEGCRACLDICPTGAIQLDEKGKPIVLEDFCIYCLACQRICPSEAIDVRITHVNHTEVRAAAWLTALKKLASHDTMIKELELNLNSERRRRLLIEDRYQPIE